MLTSTRGLRTAACQASWFQWQLARVSVSASARLRLLSTETRTFSGDPSPPPTREKPAPAVRGQSNAAPSSSAARSPAEPPQPSTSKATSSSSSGETAVGAAKKGSFVQRTWSTIKHEARHYWHGTKLLGKDIAISWRLLRKLLRGQQLTRRESRQLTRTTKDIFRAGPFLVFVIVPLGELLLPVFIRFFPGMLPSTFAKAYELDEKKRKLLKVRLEMAKFLQTTIRETGVAPSQKALNSEAFKEFFRKVRATGESPSTEDVLRVASLFEDNLTLDNLSRPQLVSMCRYMNINAFGTDNFLRHTIRTRMDKLRQDDRVIDREGLDALSDAELTAACQSRGIQTQAKSPDDLRTELAQWIELHMKRGIAGTLLVLGKAFSFGSSLPTEAGETNQIASLRDVLSSLPDNLVSATELEVSEDAATPQQRLEVLEQQEDLIEDEQEQEDKARRDDEEARRAKEEDRETERAETEGQRTEEGVAQGKPEEVAARDAHEETTSEASADDAGNLTTEQLKELGSALSILSDKSSVLKERQELAALERENREAAELAKKDEAEGEAPDKAAANLAKRIKSMIEKLDTQLADFDESVGHRMHLVEVGPDGKISSRDLRKALTIIAHRPSDESLDQIISQLDWDKDGFVSLEEIVALAQREGLGIVLEDSSQNMVDSSRELRKSS